MAFQHREFILAECDRCGLPDDTNYPGFETEAEAEDSALDDLEWKIIDDELVCFTCIQIGY